MIVKSCLECPFFQTSLTTLVSAPDGGVCSYSKEEDATVHIRFGMRAGVERDQMMARAAKRLHVKDARVVPPACPLHERDVVITVGS